jgi:SAM-dependent methyltransferase
MSGWSAGYVTDITYVTGWYRQQSPAMMALACLMGSVDMKLPVADDPLQVLELGCGQGFGAMILAASNPAWHVTAVDFNPAHIAAARLWAAEAQLTNVTFIEADLASLAEDPASRQIPEADFVTLHGVWSWVPRSVQDGIVRLLRSKVRAGGVVHVSYNALPAWGPALGMQRVLREAGRRLAWRSDRQAEEGLAIIQSLAAAEAKQLNQSPFSQTLISRLDKMPAAYLAHEYMNEHWNPCFMADVAGAFADAKLDYVASSQLIENFPDLLLTETQKTVMQKFEDPIMREMVKDLCVERALRHDVYVRGAQRMDPAGRDAALGEVRIGLNIDPDDLPLEVQMPAGNAELNPGFYQPIVHAASKGPALIKDLLALPEVEGRRHNPAELVGMLVGLELADLVARPESEPGAEAMRFNSVTARRFVRSENLTRIIALASQRTGAGVATSLLDLIVLERLRAGQTDMEVLLRQIDPAPEHVDQVRQTLDQSLNKRMPFLRAAGVF